MRQIYAEQYTILPLGKWQEHQARQIIFDISEWTALYARWTGCQRQRDCRDHGWKARTCHWQNETGTMDIGHKA